MDSEDGRAALFNKCPQDQREHLMNIVMEKAMLTISEGDDGERGRLYGRLHEFLEPYVFYDANVPKPLRKLSRRWKDCVSYVSKFIKYGSDDDAKRICLSIAESPNDPLKTFEMILNGLLLIMAQTDDQNRYISNWLGRMARFAPLAEHTSAEVIIGMQIMALQARNIQLWLQKYDENPELLERIKEIRITSNPEKMLKGESPDFGLSYLEASTIPEDLHLSWGGWQRLESQVVENIQRVCEKDSWRKMNFKPLKRIVKKGAVVASVVNRIGAIQEQTFTDAVPGTHFYMTTPAQLNEKRLDVVFCPQEVATLYNVKFDPDNTVREVFDFFLSPRYFNAWGIALPGYWHYFITRGDMTQISRISLELTEAEAELINPDFISNKQNPNMPLYPYLEEWEYDGPIYPSAVGDNIPESRSLDKWFSMSSPQPHLERIFPFLISNPGEKIKDEDVEKLKNSVASFMIMQRESGLDSKDKDQLVTKRQFKVMSLLSGVGAVFSVLAQKASFVELLPWALLVTVIVLLHELTHTLVKFFATRGKHLDLPVLTKQGWGVSSEGLGKTGLLISRLAGPVLGGVAALLFVFMTSIGMDADWWVKGLFLAVSSFTIIPTDKNSDLWQVFAPREKRTLSDLSQEVLNAPIPVIQNQGLSQVYYQQRIGGIMQGLAQRIGQNDSYQVGRPVLHLGRLFGEFQQADPRAAQKIKPAVYAYLKQLHQVVFDTQTYSFTHLKKAFDLYVRVSQKTALVSGTNNTIMDLNDNPSAEEIQARLIRESSALSRDPGNEVIVLTDQSLTSLISSLPKKARASLEQALREERLKQMPLTAATSEIIARFSNQTRPLRIKTARWAYFKSIKDMPGMIVEFMEWVFDGISSRIDIESIEEFNKLAGDINQQA